MTKFAFLVAFLSFAGSLVGNTVDVYFGTSGRETKGIYAAKFDLETGKLTKATLAAEIGRPGFLTFHPDRKTLYAVGSLNGEACVAAYRVERNGGLSFLNTVAIGDGGGAHLAVHPSGKFLLTAQYGGGSVALFSLKDDGSLKKREALVEHEGGSGVVARRQAKPHPHWTGYSPDGRFAFVPDLGMDKVVVYRVNEDGPSIETHGYGETVPGGGPRHMRFSIDGKFVYLLNELSLSVTTFAYDAAKGTMERLTTTQALSDEVKGEETFNSSSEILTHPNGRFVYSANRGDDSVTAYKANPGTGKLEVIEVEAVRGAFPRNIDLDAKGQWLLAAGQDSNTICTYSIDQDTGELTYVQKSVINVPGPICILLND
ncbi:MAG: lactonase family protein [Verrucomicrobiota bacterium]